jgi:hypothetical protein
VISRSKYTMVYIFGISKSCSTKYKLYDLVKVGRKPPLNGHGPLKKRDF